MGSGVSDRSRSLSSRRVAGERANLKRCDRLVFFCFVFYLFIFFLVSVVGFLFLLLWFRFSFWLVLRLHLVESILVYFNIFLVRCLVGVGFFFLHLRFFFVEFCRFFAFDPFCLCSPLGHWSVRHFGFLSPVATFSFHNVVEPVLL